MTTIRLAAQVLRFRDVEDDESSILSVRQGSLSAFVNSRDATFRYAPERYMGDDWPDVDIRYPSELQLTDDKGRRLDLDEADAFVGTISLNGRKTVFMFIEDELSDGLLDGYLIRLGGDPLPVLRSVLDATKFLMTASLARVNSGDFAPGRDIPFASIPGSRITENDTLLGTPGRDVYAGGPGDDILIGRGGDDLLQGGVGNDRLEGGPGRDVLRGGAGADRLFGGLDADRLFGDAGNDVLNGREGSDYLNGGAGRDQLIGGAGSDRLEGGLGFDVLTGGAGADVFIFTRVTDSPRGADHDVVADFARGDKINLSGIDANTRLAGNQAFEFNGTTPDANAVWYVRQSDRVMLRADQNGDGRADFELELTALDRLLVTDLIL